MERASHRHSDRQPVRPAPRAPLGRILRGAVGAAAGLVLVTAAGCIAPRRITGDAGGHVLVLPGIGGNNGWTQRLASMIDAEVAGVSAEVWDWTCIEPVGFLGDLMDERRNRRRAAVLAQQLVEWRQAHPDARLYLTAHSGGAGVVLFTCEALPADFRIERIVFISPAVSAGVDLTPALERSRLGVVNYYSERDRWILGLGTQVFGTTDRRRVRSAGLIGFRPPDDDRYDGKVTQIAWEPSMIPLGNVGAHMTGMAPAFVRVYLLPLFEPAGRTAPAPARATPGR